MEPPVPVYRGDQPYVFVSYSHRDSAAVYPQLRSLQQAGINVWYDEGISAGGSWSDELAEAILTAHALVFFGTPNAATSKHCIAEVSYALDNDVPVLAAYLAHTEMPKGMQLRLNTQQALSSQGADDVRFRAALVDGLDKYLSAEGRAAASPNTPANAVQRSGAGAEPESVRHYLESLRDDHSFVEIRGMGAERVERLPLETVFTYLGVSVGGDGNEHPRRPLDDVPIKELVGKVGADTAVVADFESQIALHAALDRFPHAALVGDPGSGKTTCLRFVALALARLGLGEAPSLSRLGRDVKALAPLPIFVRADDVGRFLARQPDPSLPDESPRHFLRFLDWWQGGMLEPLPEGFLRQRIERGGCFLLVDGLDEVAGEAMRARLSEIMVRIIRLGHRVGNRHLITCRTRAWQGRVQMQDAHVETLHLAPLGDRQIEDFVERWVGALYQLPAGASIFDEGHRQALAYAEELMAAIESNPSSEVFTANPMMLTVLSVLHWSRRKLPEQRADLYQAAIGYLMGTREADGDFTDLQRTEALQALALAMFLDPGGAQSRIGRTDAAEVVASRFGLAVGEALQMLEREALLSGVFLSRSEGEFEFWHLTFQEYLAACELVQDEERWSIVSERLLDDRWREVILLMTGCLRSRSGDRAVRRLVERILGRMQPPRPDDEVLAELLLIGQMREDVLPYGGDPTRDTDFAERLCSFVDIFDEDGRAASDATRIELGRRLGQIGDPRLRDEMQDRLFFETARCRLGAQNADPDAANYARSARWLDGPVFEANVDAFWVSRYPVTVGAFETFVNAARDGYLREDLWSEVGWAWRQRQDREQPGHWEQQLRFPNQWVSYVAYFEAEAYCAWAGGHLPSEAEWERVLRSGAPLALPRSPRRKRIPQYLMRPYPVGVLPYARMPTGVADLRGFNEWCRDAFALYEGAQVPDDWYIALPRPGEEMVVRSGIGRGNLTPDSSGPGLSFRVAWSGDSVRDGGNRVSDRARAAQSSGETD